MALDIDSPFWKFSLQVYSAPGVAAECLELQDRFGLDVNVVLFAAWLATARGVALDASDVDRINKAAQDWSHGVVLPLRTVRRRLKAMPEIGQADVQALRKRVADTELLSEQIEQALLYQLAGNFRPSETGRTEATLRANIAAVLKTRVTDAQGVQQAVQVPCLITAATRTG